MSFKGYNDCLQGDFKASAISLLKFILISIFNGKVGKNTKQENLFFFAVNYSPNSCKSH